MSDFQVVANEFRGPDESHRKSPQTLALLEGKTIFIPLNGRSVRSVRMSVLNAGTSNGFRAFTRHAYIDGVEGVVGWFGEKR